MRLVLLICLLSLPVPCVWSQSTATQFQLVRRAKQALSDQDYATAAKAANEIADSTTDHEFLAVAADTLLRCGDSKRALVLFDLYVKAQPDSEPYLWQRGIAHYFEGKFKDGTNQFEIHRKVNPNDVENAAWHFLCVAKEESADEAKKLLLPAPNDSRAPMKEVLEMFETGNTEPVTEKMNSFADGTAIKKSAQFYGNFYLGLYADAQGDAKTAKKHMDLAAEESPKNYMGDIAKVYAKHLSK